MKWLIVDQRIRMSSSISTNLNHFHWSQLSNTIDNPLIVDYQEDISNEILNEECQSYENSEDLLDNGWRIFWNDLWDL